MAQDELLRSWGQNIRAQREALTAHGAPRISGADDPMTQARLGELLNPPVGQSVVSRWERGLMEPRRNHKAQLGRVLCVDVRLLFPLTRSVA